MAGIDKNLTYHASRRTFATLTAAEGADTYTIKNYLGHSSVTMSERYMKWSKQLALESAEKNHLIDIKKIVHRTKKRNRSKLPPNSGGSYFIFVKNFGR